MTDLKKLNNLLELFYYQYKNQSNKNEILLTSLKKPKIEYSWHETFKLIKEIMNSDANVITDEKRIRPDLSEVNRLFGDNSLMRKLTTWEPKYSGIEGFKKGLIETIDWFLKSNNIDHYKSDIFNV